jgi:glycine/D-amino acid oxidase-like deaminating enzyme
VVIVGGGAVGSSIAYHLAVHPRFAGSVTVIERDPLYQRASSSLSASSIRQQFSTGLNVAMSQFGLRFVEQAPQLLAVAGDRPAFGLHLPGYLFLASPAGLGILRENHAVQRAAGAEVVLLDPASLRRRFPWLAVEGVAEGALGMSGEGWFDGPALLAALRRRARSLGVTYLAAEATGFERSGAAVTGVTLADGAVVPCDMAVNAAGPWSARVAAWAGVDLPVRARRRTVFVFACRTGFICGRSPRADEPDPDEPPLEVDEAEFTEVMWPVLAGRVPDFEAVKLTGAWAGYYELNVFDANGVVGRHPDIASLLFASGFSGHGLQHAPAVGRGVAELIADGGYVTLDLTPLGVERIIADRRMTERNVV